MKFVLKKNKLTEKKVYYVSIGSSYNLSRNQNKERKIIDYYLEGEKINCKNDNDFIKILNLKGFI